MFDPSQFHHDRKFEEVQKEKQCQSNVSVLYNQADGSETVAPGSSLAIIDWI